MQKISEIYVEPIIAVHTTLDDATEFLDRTGVMGLIAPDDFRMSVQDLAILQNRIILGEPGVGKTLLMHKLANAFSKQERRVESINLRVPDVDRALRECLANPNGAVDVLLLDGLDEVQAERLPAILHMLDTTPTEHPNTTVYVSARVAHVIKHRERLKGYQFVTISQFTREQVGEYLEAANLIGDEINELLERIASVQGDWSVVSVPRYLCYFVSYVKTKGIAAARNITRNELFEYFIYEKLRVEDEKKGHAKWPVARRILEKLALVMEIYQVNSITYDEIMTFFDELQADIKLVTLTQMSLEDFYTRSLLRPSNDDSDAISFENSEFQEYLAAKEITRFSDPNRAAFAFATDANLGEIHTSWLNTLLFFVDMRPELLDSLISFSGLRTRDSARLVDPNFMQSLARVDARRYPPNIRTALFKDLIDYYNDRLQWIPPKLAVAMATLYDPSLESGLQKSVESAERQLGLARQVPLGNIASVVEHLFRESKLDGSFWRGRLLAYAADTGENEVVRRYALHALSALRDPTVIDGLPDLVVEVQLIADAFVSLCAEAAPDHSKSIEYFVAAVKAHNYYGRVGLGSMKESDSFVRFLHALAVDEAFREEFLSNSRYARTADYALVRNIESAWNDEIKILLESVLKLSFSYSTGHEAAEASFVADSWHLLCATDAEFFDRFCHWVVEQGDEVLWSYVYAFLGRVITSAQLHTLLRRLLIGGAKQSALQMMRFVRSSRRADSSALFEEGREYLGDEYEQSESINAASHQPMDEEKLLERFRLRLEPETGHWMSDVFRFYTQNQEALDLLLGDDDRNRLAKLVEDEILGKINPLDYDLTITERKPGSKSYTLSEAVRLFGDAIRTAKMLGLNVTAHRQHIINYIPYAYENELRDLFALVPFPRMDEFRPVMEVYAKTRKDDLSRFMPRSFIDAVETFGIIEAASILKKFVESNELEDFDRKRAMTVLDKLSPDPKSLSDIFQKYQASNVPADQQLAELANALLISSHGDRPAIEWRLKELMQREVGFMPAKATGAHSVGAVEDELTLGRSFARPLIELALKGYEDDYLQLLDHSLECWERGEQYHAYAEYLWGIVYAYFNNQRQYRSYSPWQRLEMRITGLSGREGANWMAAKFTELRRLFLAEIGKPRNMSAAVQIFNKVRDYSVTKIASSVDLWTQIINSCENELTRWIEGEGAYRLVGMEWSDEGLRHAKEELVQKTLKAQLENILLKRGFELDFVREPQLLDDKRVDFWVRYGFFGPVLVEVKLTSNSDMKRADVKKSSSFKSMSQYMGGFHASHGIVLLLQNSPSAKLVKIRKAFESIENVKVVTCSCIPVDTIDAPARKEKSAAKKKSATKKNATASKAWGKRNASSAISSAEIADTETT